MCVWVCVVHVLRLEEEEVKTVPPWRKFKSAEELAEAANAQPLVSALAHEAPLSPIDDDEWAAEA